MAAAMLLGWEEIEVRLTGELSDNELRALELEENIRRKDLTEYEKSRNLAELVNTVKEIVQSDSDRTKAKTRGAVIPGSYQDISNRTGIPQTTLKDAVGHVNAITNHPELKDLPKYEAIKRAKVLDNPGKKQEFIEKAKDTHPLRCPMLCPAAWGQRKIPGPRGYHNPIMAINIREARRRFYRILINRHQSTPKRNLPK